MTVHALKWWDCSYEGDAIGRSRCGLTVWVKKGQKLTARPSEATCRRRGCKKKQENEIK